MKKEEIKELIVSVSLTKGNTDLEFVIFELIFDLCIEKNYKIENFILNDEECSLCEEQKFVHLVAMQDDEILDLIYEFHKAFSEVDFCKEVFKSKFELQMFENSFEISL